MANGAQTTPRFPEGTNPEYWLDYLDGARHAHQKLIEELLDAVIIFAARYPGVNRVERQVQRAMSDLKLYARSLPDEELSGFELGVKEAMDSIRERVPTI